MRGLTLALAAVTLLVGCDKPDGRAAPDNRPLTAIDSALAPLLEPIDTAITLGAWRAAHPRESVVNFDNPAIGSFRRQCRVMATSVVVAGDSMVRYAVFHVPNRRGDELLPDDTAHLADRLCTLRELWLQRDDSNRARTERLRKILDSTIVSRGARAADRVITESPTNWDRYSAWDLAGHLVVLGFARAAEETDVSDAHADRVVAAAVFWADQQQREDTTLGAVMGEDNVARETLRRAYLDSTLHLIGVPIIESSLRAAAPFYAPPLGEEFQDGGGHARVSDSIRAAAAHLVESSGASLPAPRRAAALLAAGLTLDEYIGGDTTNAEKHPWLWRAWRADSMSAAGQMALRVLLARGWGSHALCGDTPNGGERVAARAEASLRQTPADPLLHYFLARAYHDQAQFGSMLGTRRAPGLDSVIAEYRRAILVPQRALSDEAWRYGIRAMLGIHAGSTFVCFYD